MSVHHKLLAMPQHKHVLKSKPALTRKVRLDKEPLQDDTHSTNLMALPVDETGNAPMLLATVSPQLLAPFEPAVPTVLSDAGDSGRSDRVLGQTWVESVANTTLVTVLAAAETLPTAAGSPSAVTAVDGVAPGGRYVSLSGAESMSFLGSLPMGAVATAVGLAAVGAKAKTSVEKDTTPPTLLSATTNKDGAIVLTFSETLSASLPAASSFAVKADGTTVAVNSVAAGADGHSMVLTLAAPIASLKAVTVGYTAPAASLTSTYVSDSAGNHAANFADQVVTVTDAIAPTLSSSTAYTSADATRVVLIFSEPLQTAHIPDKSAFTIYANGIANPAQAIEVVGSEVRLTLSNKLPSSGSANLIQVAYAAPATDNSINNPALQDVTGNDVASTTTQWQVAAPILLTTPPVFVSGNLNAFGTQITLIFSSTLDAYDTAAASAFEVQVSDGGVTRLVVVDSVSVSGSTVVLTLHETLNSETAGVQVRYADPSAANDVQALQDLAGNDAISFAYQTLRNNVDVTAPAKTGVSLKDSSTVVLAYNESLSTTAIPAANEFAVTNNGIANVVKSVSVSGSTVLLTLTNPVASGDVTKVSYNPPAGSTTAESGVSVQDAIGNKAASFADVVLDTTAPTLLANVPQSTSNGVTTLAVNNVSTNYAGTQVFLTFSEAMLSTNLPASSSFTLQGAVSGAHTVSSVSVSGNIAALTLATPFQRGEALTMSYAAPAAAMGTSNAAFQDLSGNDLAGFGLIAPLSVVNLISPSVTSTLLDVAAGNSTVGLGKVVLSFNDTLDNATAPALSAFNVAVNGTSQAISAVSVSGKQATLDLTTPITSATPLTLSYTPPSTNFLKDSDGNPVLALSGTTLGSVYSGTGGVDNYVGTGATNYFLGSLGADTFDAANVTNGNTAHIVWPSAVATGLSSTSVTAQTVNNFGLKNATGTNQGSSNLDYLDIHQLLSGYTASSTLSDFVQFTKNSSNQVVMSVDHDGKAGSSTTFAPDFTLTFGNLLVDTSTSANLVTVNASPVVATAGNLNAANLSLSNLLTEMLATGQLRVL